MAPNEIDQLFQRAKIRYVWSLKMEKALDGLLEKVQLKAGN